MRRASSVAVFPVTVLALATWRGAGTITASPAEPQSFRYELAPGDHLVYRETLERRIRTAGEASTTAYEWETHVLVAGAAQGLSAVGFQRNRKVAPPAAAVAMRFAEANLLDGAGWPASPWVAAREVHSEALPFVHEIEPLPRDAVAAHRSWRQGAEGVEYRLVTREGDEPSGCRTIQGRGSGGAFRTRVTHCDAHGPTRVEMVAEYLVPGGKVRETVRFDRTGIRRGESPASWLADGDLALGTLAAAHRATWVAVPAESLEALAGGEDALAARQALSLILRRRLPPPSATALARARGSADARLRALAERFDPATAPSSPPGPCAPRPRPAEVPGTTLRGMAGEGNRGWPYVLHVPEEYRGDVPFPLLIVLGGGSGRALMALGRARTTIAEQDWLVAIPQADGMWWDEPSDRLLDALLDELFGRLNVDRDRVFLAGSSNGATGAYRLAARRPDIFAGVALLMGAGPATPQPAPPAANLEGLDLLVLHGAQDGVIPAAYHRGTVAAIREHAPQARLEEEVLAARGHDLVLDSLEGRAAAFLARRRREPFPSRVRLVAREGGRRAWLEVAQARGTADVTATRTGAVVRLVSRGAGRIRLLLRRELAPEGTTLRVERDGRVLWEGPVAHDALLLARTCAEGGDPSRAYSAVVELTLP